jgi:glutathione synthase/RimK-type ligase-like ATP-grasp enzyme
MHPGDRVVARRECAAFNKGFWGLIAADALWVNPIAGRDRANAKAIQLQEAIRSGLTIPDTLFSNDPGQIRKFLSLYPGEAIYKGFNPIRWSTEDGTALLYTNKIGLADLPDDEVLMLTPGIFQREVEKAYELRITFMGDYACSAKLLSQQHPVARLDWRSGGTEIEAVPDELPDDLYEACRLLMRRLGIVFGCLDIVITPQGERIFLEVNEMGQFLWLEESNPDFLLLEAFCQFLIQGGLARDWRPSRTIVHFGDFADNFPEEQDTETLHVSTPDYFAVSDCED